jgi:two-component system sensor histidine kinase BaeS
MPPWWPAGETWPPRHSPARPGEFAFPIRVAVVVAIVLHLAILGALAIATTVFGPFERPIGWPVSATLLVALVAGLFVLAMRRVGAPLTEIVAAVHRVADGELGTRVDERGLPWLRSLARAFNTMTTRLDRQQRERRQLVADIAHELRTPLAVIQGRAEGMLDGVYPRDEEQVARLLDQTRVLSRLIDDLRTSANAEAGVLTLHREPTDLAVLLEETADGFRAEASARQVSITVDVANDLPLLSVDPLRVREIVSNLLSNALRYAPQGTVVTIECANAVRAVRLGVTDSGPGIPEGDRQRVFERFYKGTTSTGSGLGLSIVRSLTLAHGGTIAVTDGAHGGTMFCVTFPRS